MEDSNAYPDGLRHSDSIYITCSPDSVYRIVSDVTRTGEWSPVCRECWWDEGAGPFVGAWFTGRNNSEVRGLEWQTRSQVVVAEPGREFAWIVGDGWARWGYEISEADGGVRLTESWHLRPEGIALLRERYGADAQAQIDERTQAAHDGIRVSLSAIKRIAESS